MFDEEVDCSLSGEGELMPGFRFGFAIAFGLVVRLVVLGVRDVFWRGRGLEINHIFEADGLAVCGCGGVAVPWFSFWQIPCVLCV